MPGLSSEHRKKIKAQLLRADSAFERSLDADPDSDALVSMRQAFDRIAGVLFDAGILTEDLLRKDIPQLVWDSAIAGGWWRLASETRQDIFPEQLSMRGTLTNGCTPFDRVKRRQICRTFTGTLRDIGGTLCGADTHRSRATPDLPCGSGFGLLVLCRR